MPPGLRDGFLRLPLRPELLLFMRDRWAVLVAAAKPAIHEARGVQAVFGGSWPSQTDLSCQPPRPMRALCMRNVGFRFCVLVV